MSYITNSTAQPSKIAISIWLYHIDLWPEFYYLIKPFKNHIKLYIGLYKNNDNSQILNTLANDVFDSYISYHDNYGADVAPFLKHLSLITEKIFIKIHSKKSMFGVNSHVNWRVVLLHSLLGSWPILSNNLYLLQQPNIGGVCHHNLVLSNRETYHKSKIVELCDNLNINHSGLDHKFFPAGNMFMGLTEIYQKYFTNNIIDYFDSKLKNEIGKINDEYPGTYSHALERIFGYILENDGKKFTHPTFNTYKIYNQNLNQYFNLIIMYNKDCYLMEDLNVYGQTLHNDRKTINIRWLHRKQKTDQLYSIRHGFLIAI